MNAFLRKVATVCVAFLLCASMGTIAFANDLPIYSEWAKAEVSAAENEGLLPFEMYDDCRRALHRDWATAFLVKFVEIATNASIEGSDVQVFDDVPVGHTMFEDINKAYAIGITKGTGDGSKFEPYRDVTREEYATMLYRTFDYGISEHNSQTVSCENMNRKSSSQTSLGTLPGTNLKRVICSVHNEHLQ